MNKVQGKLLIRFQSDEDNNHLRFSPEWNFTIDAFHFTFIDKDHVQVSFEYEAESTELWSKKQVAYLIPSDRDPEFYKKKEKLENIIDLISLSTGHGIKVKTGSVTLSAQGIGSSNPVENTKVVVLPDIDGITKRVACVKNRGERGLYNALRAYRMSLSYEQPEEKIAKLWSAMEQLYSKSGGRLFTDEEYQKLEQFLNEWKELPEKKRVVLLQRVHDTPETSPMDSMVAKVKLMNEDGNLATTEVKAILSEWRSIRSSTAHGGRGSNREVIDDVLWDIEGTVETLIGSQVYPKMIRYLFFRESDVNKDFLERQGILVRKVSNEYCAYAIKYDEFDLYKSFLPNEITSSDACVYIISHNVIHKLTKTELQELEVSQIDASVKNMLLKIQREINEETE